MFELPNTDETVKKINEWYDSTEFIWDIYENIKTNSSWEKLYEYFSDVYDELFTDLILKKTFVSNDTKKMLELLATPIYKKSIEEREKIYNKIEDKKKKG